MTKLNVIDARCAALFVSELQRSDAPAGYAVAEAVAADRTAVRRPRLRGPDGPGVR